VTALGLRPYQVAAVASVRDAWRRGVARPAVVLPTGTGKTVVFCRLAETEADRRPIILVHRDELVRQTETKLLAVCPDVSVGVIQGPRHETGCDVTVASVATLSRPERLAATPAHGLVIVDECHHAAAPGYRRIMSAWPGSVAAGFTATLHRQGGGLGDVWEEVVHDMDVLEAIRGGHLVDVVGRAVRVDGLDLASVARASGDWVPGDLGRAMVETGAGAALASAWRSHASREDGSPRPGIVFAPDVMSAHQLAHALREHGIPTETVTGAVSATERADIYGRCVSGQTVALSSCMALTEGFDMPHLEVAAVARPTSSPGLYTQMVGRVLRPAPWAGKEYATVLDLVGATGRHRLATLADLTTSAARPEDGESLSRAAERESPAYAGPVAGQLLQDPEVDRVSVFGASSSAWMRTRRGTWFLPTREKIVFLWAHEHGYRVGLTKDAWTARGGAWAQDGRVWSIDMAMAWAEQTAAEIDPTVSLRDVPWRTRRARPSDGQIKMLSRLGIPPDGMTKADAAEAISVSVASRLLDRQ
jgi:superfamily II DNA or RNA helicase